MMQTILTVESVLGYGPCQDYRDDDAALLRRLVGDGITLEAAWAAEAVYRRILDCLLEGA